MINIDCEAASIEFCGICETRWLAEVGGKSDDVGVPNLTSSFDRTASGSKGAKPEPLNPALTFSLVINVKNAAQNAMKKSILVTWLMLQPCSGGFEVQQDNDRSLISHLRCYLKCLTTPSNSASKTSRPLPNGNPESSTHVLILAKQCLPRTCHSLISSHLTRLDQKKETAPLLGPLDLVVPLFGLGTDWSSVF